MLILKALLGAAIVVLMAILAKSKNYYIVGLIPLFPTFAIIGHVIVASEQNIKALKETIIFGMWSLIPYFAYLITIYFLVEHYPLWITLILGIISWLIISLILIYFWGLYK